MKKLLPFIILMLLVAGCFPSTTTNNTGSALPQQTDGGQTL